jgi:hypothetical protein
LALIKLTRTRDARFACGPRGVWIEDEHGRAPMRPARMVCRWWYAGHGWMPKGRDFQHVENGGVLGAAPIAPEGQTPAGADSTRWFIVGKRH